MQISDEYIRVKVIPQSNKNEIIDYTNDKDGITLKIKIKATPEKNKANIELIKFLSKELNASKEEIKIISGLRSRTKLIKIK